MEKWEREIKENQFDNKVHILKSLYSNEIEKARAGVYEDNPVNRKLGRVGQKYGDSKNIESKKEQLKQKLEKELKEGAKLWFQACNTTSRSQKDSLIEGAKSKITNAIKNNIDFSDPEIAYNQLNEIKNKNPLVNRVVYAFKERLRHSINVKYF